MSAKENQTHIIRKQCNIGKYETLADSISGFSPSYHKCVETLSTRYSKSRCSSSAGHSLRQTNVFYSPVFSSNKLDAAKGNGTDSSGKTSKQVYSTNISQNLLGKSQTRSGTQRNDMITSNLPKKSEINQTVSIAANSRSDKSLKERNQCLNISFQDVQSLSNNLMMMKDSNVNSDIKTPKKSKSSFSKRYEEKTSFIYNSPKLTLADLDTSQVDHDEDHRDFKSTKQSSDISDLCYSGERATRIPSDVSLLSNTPVQRKCFDKFNFQKASPYNSPRKEVKFNLSPQINSQLLLSSHQDLKAKIEIEDVSESCSVFSMDRPRQITLDDLYPEDELTSNQNKDGINTDLDRESLKRDRTTTGLGSTDLTDDNNYHLLPGAFDLPIPNNDLIQNLSENSVVENHDNISESDRILLTEQKKTMEQNIQDCSVYKNNNTGLNESWLGMIAKQIAYARSYGASISPLQLHLAMQQLNQIERADLMRKHRCFKRWRKNVRLMQLLRRNSEMKWKRAIHHHNRVQLNQHFQAWIFFVKHKKAAAIKLYRIHMFHKGMTALKWYILNCREQVEHVTAVKNFATMTRLFHLWQKRFDSRRSNRLQTSFTRWRNHYQHILILAIIQKKTHRQKLIQFYALWRQRFYQSQVDNAAIYFNSITIKKKVWQAWMIYVADCDVRRAQDCVAAERFQIRTLTKIFMRWKRVARKVVHARSTRKKKILHSRMQQWMRESKKLKVQHLKQISSANKLRRKHILRKTLHEWLNQMRVVLLAKKREDDHFRYCFLYWRLNYVRTTEAKSLADGFHTKSLLNKHIQRWKMFPKQLHLARSAASYHLQRCTMISVMESWKQFVVEKRRIRRFICHLQQSAQISKFLVWKSFYYKRIAEKEKKNQWSLLCVRRALYKWMEITRIKNLERKCEKLKRRKMKKIIKNCVLRWKKSYQNHQEKLKRADILFSTQSIRKVGVMFREWRKVTEESFIIQPIFERIQRRQKTKVFDAWRTLLARKEARKKCVKLRELNAINFHFLTWRSEFIERVKLDTVLYKRQENLKLRSIQKWRKFAQRHKHYTWLVHQRYTRSLKSIFYSWSIRATQRSIMAEEMIQKEIRIRQILTQAFNRWKRETLCEKILREDAVASFLKDHELSLKFSTFRVWKKNLINHRLANEFVKIQKRQRLSITLYEWHEYTRSCLIKRTHEFSNSLRSLSNDVAKHIRNKTTSYCDETAFNDAAYTEKMTLSPKILIETNCTVTASSDHVTDDSGVDDLIRDASETSSFLSGRHQHRIFSTPINTPVIRTTERTMVNVADHASLVPGVFAEQPHSDNALNVTLNEIQPDDNDFKQVSLDVSSQSTIDKDETTRGDDDTVCDKVIGGTSIDATTLNDLDGSYCIVDSGSELTLNDLIARNTSGSDSEESSLSTHLITQRYIFADTDCLNSEFLDRITPDVDIAANLFLHDEEDRWAGNVTHMLPRRPRNVLEVLPKDCSTSQYQCLVHFIISRLRAPHLSRAFHQWKLLIHAMEWDKSMMNRGMQKISTLTLKNCFQEWRQSCRKIDLADNFHCSALTRPIITSWYNWSKKKSSIKRLKVQAQTIDDSRIMKIHFNCWVETFKQRIALNELLKLWESRPADHELLGKYADDFEKRRHIAISRECLFVWKMKANQILLSDKSYQDRLLHKILMLWSEYSAKKFEARQVSNVISNKLLKKRFLHTWKRSLAMRDRVEEMNRLSNISWLSSLLFRWKTFTDSRKDAQKRKFRLESFVKNSAYESVKEGLRIWRRKLLLRQRANQLRERAMMLKIVISWRKYVNVRKERGKNLKDAIKRRDNNTILSHFECWHRCYLLNGHLNTIELEKQRKLWNRWMLSLQARKKQRLEETSVLHRYFLSWVTMYRERKRLIELSRKYFNHWHFVTNKNCRLLERANLFLTSRNRVVTEFNFVCWMSAYKQSRQSREHFHLKISGRFVAAWYEYTDMRIIRKREIEEMCSKGLKRRLFRMWQRELMMKRKVTLMQARSVQSWLIILITRWRQWSKDSSRRRNAHDHVMTLNNYHVVKKCIEVWKQRLCLQQNADQSRKRLLLCKSVALWKDNVDRRKTLKKKMSSVKAKREYTMVAERFKYWKRSSVLTALEKELRRKKLKTLLCDWKECFRFKRSQRFMRKTFLRRHFSSWLVAHREATQNRNLSRRIFLKWRSVTSRNVSLSKQADLFVTSQSYISTRSTFQCWFISLKRSRQARTHFELKMRKMVVTSWHRFVGFEKFKRKLVLSFKETRSKAILSSSWKLWSCKLSQQQHFNLTTEILQRNLALKLQREYWLLWLHRMSIAKAKEHRRKTLMSKVMMSWYWLVVSKQKKSLMLRHHCDVVKKKILCDCYRMWRITYNNNRYATMHSRNLVKSRQFKRWRNWALYMAGLKSKSVEFRSKRIQARKKLCLNLWNERYEDIKEMSLVADVMFQKHQNRVTLKCWSLWRKKHEEHQMEKLRMKTLTLQYLKKWRRFVEKKTLKKTILHFQLLSVTREALNEWKRRGYIKFFANVTSSKDNYDVIAKTCNSPSRFTNPSSTVLAISYGDHHALIKAWTAWRLNLIFQNAIKEMKKRRDIDMLYFIFQKWRDLTLYSRYRRNGMIRSSRIPTFKKN